MNFLYIKTCLCLRRYKYIASGQQMRYNHLKSRKDLLIVDKILFKVKYILIILHNNMKI